MSYQSGELLLDKYRIELLLGQGTCGEVYRIINAEIQTTRAIKIQNRNTAGIRNPDFEKTRQRFQLETQLGKSLNVPNPNPHILQVYDLVETKDELILEMQYAPGGNLADLIDDYYKKKCIPFPREKALRIAFEIALSLSSLHAVNIVHRNIKPENVLFDHRNQVILSDLGLAQIAGVSQKVPLINPQKRQEGTKIYLSPEQRKLVDVVLPASDIYSLGLLLYEMLTGRYYFSAGHRNRLRDSLPGVKLSLDDLVARMLSEIPGYRPRDGKAAAIEIYRELQMEEQAQQELAAKKQEELIAWENLKRAELSKIKQDETIELATKKGTGKTGEKIFHDLDELREEINHPVRLIEEPEVTLKTTPRQMDKPNRVDSKERHSAEIQEPERDIETSGDAPDFIDLPHKSTKIKFWPTGLILIFGLALIPLIWMIYSRQQINVINIKSTDIPTLVQTQNSMAAVPSSTIKPTEEFTSTPFSVIVLESVATPTLEATEVTPAQIMATESTPIFTEIPTSLPTIDSTPTKERPNNVPTLPPNIMANASFEDESGWVLKGGDAHISGNYSNNWASQGARSYLFSLFGDAVYEYCFTPGMRTTIKQNVELSGVNKIKFDLFVRPPISMVGFHGDKINIKTVVYLDGEQVYLSAENAQDEQMDQTISLDSKYSGKHEIKFGLMNTSKFCVKGRTEEESWLVYLDNIRFEN